MSGFCFRPLWSLIPGAAAPMKAARPSAAASCPKTRVPQPRMEFAWPGAAAPCPKTLVDDTLSCAFGAGGGRLPLTYWRHNEELRWG